MGLAALLWLTTTLVLAPSAQASLPPSDPGSPFVVYTNQTMASGTQLTNGSYEWRMQTDGNLVLYASGQPKWASNINSPGAFAKMGDDGNFVEYSKSGNPLWRTHTDGSGAIRAVMQGDGNFVLYDGNGNSVWNTNTHGGRDQMTNSLVYSFADQHFNSAPYSWGGGHGPQPGPSYGTCSGYQGPAPCQAPQTFGVDCSGFARWMYSLAYGNDVLNGGTDQQIALTTKTDSPTPGDLVFYRYTDGRPGTHHVGIWLGNGRMMNALKTGTRIQVNNIYDASGFMGYYHFSG